MGCFLGDVGDIFGSADTWRTLGGHFTDTSRTLAGHFSDMTDRLKMLQKREREQAPAAMQVHFHGHRPDGAASAGAEAEAGSPRTKKQKTAAVDAAAVDATAGATAGATAVPFSYNRDRHDAVDTMGRLQRHVYHAVERVVELKGLIDMAQAPEQSEAVKTKMAQLHDFFWKGIRYLDNTQHHLDCMTIHAPRSPSLLNALMAARRGEQSDLADAFNRRMDAAEARIARREAAHVELAAVIAGVGSGVTAAAAPEAAAAN